jgi:hypothetical protein
MHNYVPTDCIYVVNRVPPNLAVDHHFSMLRLLFWGITLAAVGAGDTLSLGCGGEMGHAQAGDVADSRMHRWEQSSLKTSASQKSVPA